jgi:hypothetical protein
MELEHRFPRLLLNNAPLERVVGLIQYRRRVPANPP